mgnify:CR=1 FL=1
METSTIPRKVAVIDNYNDSLDLADGMASVWSEFNAAQDTMRRCRRVIVANAALFNAQQRLRDRLAEFHGIKLTDDGRDY